MPGVLAAQLRARYRSGGCRGVTTLAGMANSLLDFVMALVRDPETAARYSADPAGVLAAAQLPGVTIADVNNLIPVVTDSLAAATPRFGTVSGAETDANVWMTGAAAAAFDAFDIEMPGGPVDTPRVPDQAMTVIVPAARPPDGPDATAHSALEVPEESPVRESVEVVDEEQWTPPIVSIGLHRDEQTDGPADSDPHSAPGDPFGL